ncbi:hypothetical protein Aoki45_37840 [Algoriphagus sp. oki45]|uniref:outer membrane beta-barrel protein n=1 Tax=Algoriphagus sp. oki45 TaxID=3067294 RepID=UPI0027E6155A|nr:hypothetical protein Aoki45_37840 [Algoriphagus sp. oki45]
MKTDYIIINDSIFAQGKVEGIPVEDNRVVYFIRSKWEGPKRYSVEEVSEFQVSERKFFRKQLNWQGKSQFVFLERLPRPFVKAIFWKLNGEPNQFFVEVDQELLPLEEDYKETLRSAFSDKSLENLIPITRLKESSLIYFSRTATTIQKERTFSKFASITPHAGIGLNSIEFLIPESLEEVKLQAAAPVIGLNGELFLNFYRSLSFNLGLKWSQLDAQQFRQYSWKGSDFQTDVFVDMSWVQVPVAARYYFDLNPNRFRIFAEAGLVYVQACYSTSGLFMAEIEGNQVTTSSPPLELGTTFTGTGFGLGADKYLPNRRAVVFGFNYSKATGETKGGALAGLNFYLGYKF